MEERRVMAAEDAYVAAEVGRDEASLRRLVDDRFVHNSADGTTSGKEDLIRTVLGLNMTGEAISERSVMVEGNMAFVFGTAERRVRDPGAAERSSRLRYTSVYVKRDDEWRMLALHMQPRSVR
jgi:ketosteroid isomerase-like protein